MMRIISVSIFLLLWSSSSILARNIEPTTELTHLDIPVVEILKDNKLFSNDYVTPELFDKAFTYVQGSPAFKNYTKQEFLNILTDLDRWEEPEFLVKNFPYYHAGYDMESRPVWIAEIGKFNIRGEVEKGKKNLEILLRYTFNAVYRIIKTIHEKDTPDNEVRYASFIFDLDGFDLYQFGHSPTMIFVLQVIRDYKEVIRELLGYAMLVNVNPIAQLAVNLVRPILGPILERVEVYGTNKGKWAPMIRRQFPDEVIPPWYGGDPSFKPIQVYG